VLEFVGAWGRLGKEGSRVGMLGIEGMASGGNVGFGIVGIWGKFGSGGNVSLGNVGCGRVGIVGISGLVGFGNVGCGKVGIVGIVGSVGIGNFGIEGKVGMTGNCKRWRVARLKLMLEMDIAMNKAKIKHLKDPITNE
jgi:hypothetical protein